MLSQGSTGFWSDHAAVVRLHVFTGLRLLVNPPLLQAVKLWSHLQELIDMMHKLNDSFNVTI